MAAGLRDLLEQSLPVIKKSLTAKASRPPIPKDFVEWAQARFYIPSTGNPVVLYPHQQAICKLALTRDEQGYYPYRTWIYSTVKQSGKSTIAGMVMRYYAETQRRGQELYTLGNDMDQAKLRSFREIRWSLEETPGYVISRDVLPGEWIVQKTQMKCLLTNTEIRALAVDARGEAGGKPAIQCWTELWGAETEEARRFWDELTPIPTIPDSFRIVETYAGYDGESELLQSLYNLGLAGRQLTNGELRERTGIDGAFAESPGDDDLVPIWENRPASLLMYWDSGPAARRMPWQQGPRGDAYYREQEQSLTPNAFDRLHNNYWTNATSGFVPAESWDACYEPDLPILRPGDRTPIVLGVDAATTGDSFAIVAVSRHPDPARHQEHVAVRRVKIWVPSKEQGGFVSYDDPEAFIRRLCQGWCNCEAAHAKSEPSPDCESCRKNDWVPGFNVVNIAYDAHQLVNMMQRLTKDRVAWCKAFGQQGERLESDKQLYDLIMGRRLAHNGEADLRAHVIGAAAKVDTEDSKLRIVKQTAARKIDAAVALSMAAHRCLWLVLPKAAA
jgi:phage terminase large subunit-like protein